MNALTRIHKCTDKHCDNYPTNCIDIGGVHFKFAPDELIKWADAIIKGKATYESMPVNLKPFPMNLNQLRAAAGGRSAKPLQDITQPTTNITYILGGGPTL